MNFLRAAHYLKGRTEPVMLIILHTSENPCALGCERAVAGFFADALPSAPAVSSHFVVGPDAVIQCVDEADTAWHAAPVNHRSLGIEHTAYARFTDADWQGDLAQEMLRRSAAFVGDLCMEHGVPAVFIDAEGLLRGDAGITFHSTVSEACQLAVSRKMTDTIWVSSQRPTSPISTHTDPGSAFPWEAYLALVQAALPAAAGDPVD